MFRPVSWSRSRLIPEPAKGDCSRNSESVLCALGCVPGRAACSISVATYADTSMPCALAWAANTASVSGSISIVSVVGAASLDSVYPSELASGRNCGCRLPLNPSFEPARFDEARPTDVSLLDKTPIFALCDPLAHGDLLARRKFADQIHLRFTNQDRETLTHVMSTPATESTVLAFSKR